MNVTRAGAGKLSAWTIVLVSVAFLLSVAAGLWSGPSGGVAGGPDPIVIGPLDAA